MICKNYWHEHVVGRRAHTTGLRQGEDMSFFDWPVLVGVGFLILWVGLGIFIILSDRKQRRNRRDQDR